MTPDIEAAQREVVHTCRELLTQKLVYGTAGNVSIRVGDAVVISPSSVPYFSMTPDMVCVVSLDGETLHQLDANPSSEVPMHLEIYRNHDVGAVVHAHSPGAVAAGAILDEVPPIHYVARNLGGTVPVVNYARFGSAALARDVNEALGNKTGLLMRNHGAVTVGQTIDEAMERYLALEWLCDVTLRARAAGTPAILTDQQLDEVTRAAKQRGYTG